MHSWLIRGNAVLTLCTSVLAVVCIAVTLTDHIHSSNPSIHADLIEVQGLHKEYDRWVGYRERAWLAVNLTADLQDSFTWNTRQIYLWLTAEYKTEKNQLNQAVFWNWIIESKEDANIRIPRLTHTHPSSISRHPLSEHYPLDLTDQGENLRSAPFNITVSWNVMPTVVMQQYFDFQVQCPHIHGHLQVLSFQVSIRRWTSNKTERQNFESPEAQCSL